MKNQFSYLTMLLGIIFLVVPIILNTGGLSLPDFEKEYISSIDSNEKFIFFEDKTMSYDITCGERYPYFLQLMSFWGVDENSNRLGWCTSGGPGSNYCSIAMGLCETGCQDGYYSCCSVAQGCRCIPNGCEPGDDDCETDDNPGGGDEDECDEGDCDDDDNCDGDEDECDD